MPRMSTTSSGAPLDRGGGAGRGGAPGPGPRRATHRHRHSVGRRILVRALTARTGSRAGAPAPAHGTPAPHALPRRRLDGEEDRVVAATDEEEDALALAGRFEALAVGVDVLHGGAVDLEDDVAAPEAGVGGGAACVDLRDDDALQAAVEAEVLGHLRRERLHGQAEVLGGAGPRLRGLLFLQLRDLDGEVLLALVADRLQLDGLADRGSRHEQR